MSLRNSIYTGIAIAASFLPSSLGQEATKPAESPAQKQIQSVQEETKIKVQEVVKMETEKQSAEINDTLQMIAKKLRAIGIRVDEHLVENPSKGLVHWKWMHYEDDLDASLFAQMEETNAELLHAMLMVDLLPHAGLESLLQENWKEEKLTEMKANYQERHYALTAKHMVDSRDYHRRFITPPKVKNEMKNIRRMSQPFPHNVPRHSSGERAIRISALSELGAGYMLSTLRTLQLKPAEDNKIFSDALAARERGNLEEIEYLVFFRREEHILRLILCDRKTIHHLLMGYAHNFADNIVNNNRQNPQKISHIAVTVQALQFIPHPE